MDELAEVMGLSKSGIQLRIKGKVQGVGFRPYVWQLAHHFNLKGDVCNDAEGVLIRLIQNDLISNDKLVEFQTALLEQCPPLARIDDIQIQSVEWEIEPTDFSIRHSGEGRMDTQVIPDAATCPACLAELNDPDNRRYHYPFANCTHCGPRFTIIKKMPYDRPNTSMADFPLCPDCLQEYESPLDRRFHAQPNACPVCGPHIWTPFAKDEAALQQIATQLLQGKIVAVKGLGGFHLACDATNDDAVALLRQRKHRPSKPFAVMLPNLSWLAQCSNDESSGVIKLLTSTAAPIVLVEKKADSILSENVAPELTEVGVMLPSNPLQHLLMRAVNRPLVMTSGNASGKPPVLTNEDALTDLKNIADSWFLHNRDIIQRADDSLLRLNHDKTEVLRRARGYVPDALIAPDGFTNLPSIIASGADLKNAFCLLREQTAVLGPHLGDLDDPDIQAQFDHTLALFLDIYRFKPDAVVTDAHPGYASQQISQRLAEKYSVPLIKVFHHHAHIVACLAEHNWHKDAGKVIGLAIDGLGYGQNDQLWGGECLLVDYERCQHLGGLPAVALPGGELAAKQPWRNLFAQLEQFVPDWQQSELVSQFTDKNIVLLRTAIERNINSPKASSGGRLFDAVAASLGLCFDAISWEGEAACRLEVLANRSVNKPSHIVMGLRDNQLDLSTFWQQWLAYQASQEDKAYAFHFALAAGFAHLAKVMATQHQLKTIVLSGGVFHNKLLKDLVIKQLDSFNVLYPQILPMGDGGIALGQALIGATQLRNIELVNC